MILRRGWRAFHDRLTARPGRRPERTLLRDLLEDVRADYRKQADQQAERNRKMAASLELVTRRLEECHGFPALIQRGRKQIELERAKRKAERERLLKAPTAENVERLEELAKEMAALDEAEATFQRHERDLADVQEMRNQAHAALEAGRVELARLRRLAADPFAETKRGRSTSSA